MRRMSILIGICVTLIIVCALTAFVALGREYVSGVSADITKDQARQIALQDAGEDLEEVTFTRSSLQKENDRLVYLVDFYTDNISYHYMVDGTTGSIYRSDTQTAGKDVQVQEDKTSLAPDPGQAAQENTAEGLPGQTAEETDDAMNYIGVEQAKAAALEDAGLTGKQVQFDKVKLEHENNMVVYDVEFEYNKIEYDYDVDAVSGRIVDKDVEIDDD